MLAPARPFDLNIGEILEQWGARHAVRELIANALDEQAITGTAPVEIEEISKGVWRIRDYGRGLAYEHFQQNENPEKRKHASKVIGKFGVGLKDAMATLHRQKIGITISSKHGVITVKMHAKHGFDDVDTLHAVIATPIDPKFVGTEIVLTGIAAAEIEAAKAFFLRFSADTLLEETEYGQILAKPPKGKARIYVKGLLVAEEDNFLFSYNVTALTKPMEKALNRERTHVGRAAYQGRIKDMLLKAKSADVFKALAAEISKIEIGRATEELQWKDVVQRAIQVLNTLDSKPLFVPASLAREAYGAVADAEAEGRTVYIIPDQHMPRSKLDINGDPLWTFDHYLADRQASFKFDFIPYAKLKKSEQAIFDQRKAIAALVGGLPRFVKGIEITQTMRPDYEFSDHTQGLWDSESGKIIIHRGELKSLTQFAGTLLHELAHARSGHPDHSRAFENELTDMLGVVAARVLAPVKQTKSKSKPKAGKRAVRMKRGATRSR